jgi:methionine biosynthesis protein MetW
VVQGDADTDLVNYPDDAFDYVILSQTLQATRQPRVVLENMLRIGRRAIVSFPNFGFWRMRLQLLVGGHMPRTENLPATWYDTPNIHFCTIKDFVQLCDEINVKMERAVALDLYGRPLRLNAPWWFWNMFGEQGVFLLSRAPGMPALLTPMTPLAASARIRWCRRRANMLAPIRPGAAASGAAPSWIWCLSAPGMPAAAISPATMRITARACRDPRSGLSRSWAVTVVGMSAL